MQGLPAASQGAQIQLNPADVELVRMARDEIALLEPRIAAAEARLKILLLPRDPNDEKNVILDIRAGTGASNVIPGELTVLFNFRFSTASTAEALQIRVHEILDRHGLQYELKWTLGARPFLTVAGPLLKAAICAVSEVTGVEAEVSTTGGTSDGRFIAVVAKEVIEFGPLNDSIHKLNEYVEIADIEPLTRIYGRILEKLLLAA